MHAPQAIFGAILALAALTPATLAAADPAPVEVSERAEDDATTTLIHETLVEASPAEVWAAIATLA